MKRNKLFLLGLFVVFAAVLSLSLVSSTFARYTSTNNGSDTARVAKWGVEITVGSFDAFAAEYEKDDASATAISDVSVAAADSKNVLAPGTTKDLVGLDIAGEPEVAVRVTYAAELTLANWTVGSDEYCPLVFTVGTENYYIGKTGIENVAQLKAAVEAAIAEYSAEYEANSDLSTAAAPVVSWKWEIDQTTVPGQTNEKDTALGNAATAATVSLKITATVTQID